MQPGVFALDIEVAGLAKVEQLFVVTGPVVHAATVNVVRQMIDLVETTALGMAVDSVKKLEVDIVDRVALGVTIDQVQGCSTDALDRGQAQLHRPGRNLDWLGAEFERARIAVVSILDAKRHTADGGAVFLYEVVCMTLRLIVQNEVNPALAIQRDVLRAMPRHSLETKHVENGFELIGSCRGEFDEFKSIEAHRIVIVFRHGGISLCAIEFIIISEFEQ